MLLLADCQEAEDDDNTMWYTKQLLKTVCRKVLGFVDNYRHSLIEIVENMDRNQRRDHLYVYGVYELTAEQISHAEVSKVLLIIKKKIKSRTIRFVFILIKTKKLLTSVWSFPLFYFTQITLYQPKITFILDVPME